MSDLNNLSQKQLNQEYLGKHQLEACRKAATRVNTHNPAGYGRRKQPVIAINNKNEEVVTTFKNCEKQGWRFLIFADNEILSLNGYDKLS